MEFTAFGAFDLALDVLFCSDMILNFVTCYNDRGIFVADIRKIAIHYLRTWFFLDFFGSVPFDKVLYELFEKVLSTMRFSKALKKLLYTMPSHRKHTRALTFENFCLYTCTYQLLRLCPIW